MVRVPVGTDEFAIESTKEIVRDQFARMLPRFPDKQDANFIATGPMVQRTAYTKRVADLMLSLPGCRQADNVAMWMLERLSSFLERRSNRCFLQRPDWRTGLRGFPASYQLLVNGGRGIRNVDDRSDKDVRIDKELGGNSVPAVLADLSGSLGEKVLRNL